MKTRSFFIFLMLFISILLGCANNGGGGHHGGSGHGGGHRGGNGGEGGHYGQRMGNSSDIAEPPSGLEPAPLFVSPGQKEGRNTVIGTVSCDLWSRSVFDANEGRMARFNNYKAWVYGYLSGLSSSIHTPFLENVEGAALSLFISDYCKAHPGDTVAVAAQHLAHVLIDKKNPKDKAAVKDKESLSKKR